MIRRLRPPRIPRALAAAGWALDCLPGGYWWCIHAVSGAETHIYGAAGPAIEEAWRIAEPDHERLVKLAREGKL